MTAYTRKFLLTSTVLFILLNLHLICSVEASLEMWNLEPIHLDVIENVGDSTADDWPMFRYNASNSGSPDGIAPVTHDLLWETDLLMDEDASSLVGSSPAVIGGVVYIGSDDGYIYALNASSGTQLWNRTVDELYGLSVSSPAVVDGVIYFRSWVGVDYALNASNGEEIWNFSDGYSCSSPAVVNGVFYARSTGAVTALNSSTGSLIWRSSLSGNGGGSPIVVDDTVYISESGYVYALNAQNGTLRWSRDLEYMSNTYNSPAVANGILYISCASDLFYALDAETGDFIWSYPTGGGSLSTPVVSSGIVYLGSGHSGVFALDAKTGAKIWNYPTSPGMGSSVAVAGGNVYLAGNDGVMYALNAATGAKLWSYVMSNVGTSSSPSIANGVLYIRNSNGYLCAFGKASQSSISIFPAFGLEGTVVTVSGNGFTAYSTVNATFDGVPITLSSSNVDSFGHFSATVTIPSYNLGTYQITVTDRLGCFASANFTVVSDPTTSWPMFMHDYHHSGTSDNIAPLNNSLLWKFDVDRGEISNIVATSAAVVAGIVYIASHNSYVYALDAYTGTCYWRYSLPGMGTLSSPAVVDGVVYIGSDYGLHAINAYTGAKIWQSSPAITILSSPAVLGGLVYTGSFVEHSVYAFRVSDGQQVWSYTTGDYVNSSPAVVGNVVYICSDDGYLYALDAATGALIWKFNCLDNYPYESLSSSPAVANGVVYVTSSVGNVFAIDASSGDKIWNHTTADLSSFTSSPVYYNGIVYTSSGSGVYALNASTGQEIWHSIPMYAQASPAIVAGVIYVGAGDGNIYALDALTGAKIWQYETNGFIRGQTSIVDGAIYVGTGNGAIYAIGSNYGDDDSKISYSLEIDGTIYYMSASSNSSISELSFDQTSQSIRFNIDGASSTTGFCNITIPSELMSETFSLYKDDIPLVENVDYTKTYNGTHYNFSLTYEHSSHVIEIFSTTVIPELTSLMLLTTFIIAALTVVLVHRQKIGTRLHASV
jgi:eukaryotic-like serine/threonine-protein kinase